MAVTIQFKRGTSARLSEVNPILLVGEPCYVLDTGKIKIGDGETPWNDLPYLNEEYTVNASTHYDFPSIGKENVIYKAEAEKMIYQWNANELKYEVLNYSSSDDDVLDVDIINGGNAYIV